MKMLRQNGAMSSFARLLIATGAVVFLAAARAGSALETHSGACSNCHPDWPESYCAAMISLAVENCCGEYGGWAYCVNNEWGTYVMCDGQGDCQCDDWGDNCSADLEMED